MTWLKMLETVLMILDSEGVQEEESWNSYIEPGAETPEQREERRHRSCEYMQTRQAIMNREDKDTESRYMQMRRRGIAAED